MHAFGWIPRWRMVAGSVASIVVVVGALAASRAGASPASPPGADASRAGVTSPAPVRPGPSDPYERAARACPGLDPLVLVAIHDVETRRDARGSTSSAGALGPLQFLPSTWARYGRDGDGDGVADVWDLDDALAGATALLCADNVQETPNTAIWNYNHSWAYVADVQQRVCELRAAHPSSAARSKPPS